MGNTSNNLRLAPNAFAKCAPNLSTNIKQCGTVTLCKAKPMVTGDLDDAFTKSGEYRVMGSLLMHDMEIKMCEAKQNGLYDFLMANKVSMEHKVNSQRANRGLIKIAPFILARQFSPINNNYWFVTGGQSSSSNWRVDVRSSTNIPPDVRFFNPGERVYIRGKTSGGSLTQTAWIVVSATAINNFVRLVLTGQNDASALDTDNLESPVTGLLARGTANVNDFEKFCYESAAILNWKDVPFWVETTRHSICKSSEYDKWRELLLADNPLFREFGDLDEIQKNKQLGADFQTRMVNNMFWGKKLAHQTMGAYDQLEEITTPVIGSIDQGGTKCVGKRANVEGMYEQMAACGRVMDLQGAQLNMPALFNALYDIMRVRDGQGGRTVEEVDLFTDSITAEAIGQAMVKVYNSKSDNTFRMTLDVNQPYKKGEFGFRYKQFALTYPNGLVINIVTHFYFDDYLSANKAIGQEDVGRVLWILDFAGIYPGIMASNKVVNKTGDLKTLAAMDASFACVMDVPTTQQTLMSTTYTVVVECPFANLILENFSDDIPEPTTLGANVYPPTTTTTTTTSTAEV